MVIFKRILQGVAALLGIAIVVTGIILASDWLYYKRLITFDPTNSMTNMAWYEPVVEVSAGLPPAIPIADPSVRTIPQENTGCRRGLRRRQQIHGFVNLASWRTAT